MRKLFVVATLFASCFLLGGFQQDAPTNKPTQSQSSPAKPTGSRVKRAAESVAPPSQTAKDHGDANATVQPNPPQNDKVEVTALPPEMTVRQIKDGTDRTIMWCTIVLTIVGAVGTYAAVKTLREVKRQADTLEDHKTKFEELASAAAQNAKAARRNAAFTRINARAAISNATAAENSAKSFINAERAWVMVDVTCEHGSELTGESSDGDVSTALTDLKIKCRNTGHSPGWITEKVIKLAVLQQPLPEHLVLDEPKVVISEMEPISPGEASEEKQEMMLAQGRHLRTQGTVLVIYGRVSYRDIFSENRETWFCYRVDGFRNARRLVRMAEYPEYNRNT